MPKITVLPHATLCPEGAVIEDAPEGQTVLDVLLDHDIEVDHACEKSCACTTCHVIIRKGFDSLEEPSELEEDVTGCAGAGFFTGVIDFDVVVEQYVKDGFAFGCVFDDCAFGT